MSKNKRKTMHILMVRLTRKRKYTGGADLSLIKMEISTLYKDAEILKNLQRCAMLQEKYLEVYLQ